MLGRTWVIAALVLGVSACNAAAAPKPASNPSRGALSTVSAGAPEVHIALNAAIQALRRPEWLNDPTLTSRRLDQAEESGTPARTFRLTLEASNRGKVRMLRSTVVLDARGNATLTRLELGPPDSTAPLRVMPAANNLPGGFTQQNPSDAAMKAAATQALHLLGGTDWFGHPLELVAVKTAMTQVVAGLNTYLDMTVTTGGQTRQVGVIMYRDIRGNTSLSWARLALPGE
ncbi:MAG TPA: hypothetical protein V6D47_22320 [Oscillatoriaceae cyanobacterium]